MSCPPNPPSEAEPATVHGEAPQRRLKLTLAYDGSEFSGWQFQQGKRTVQGVLETALHRLTGEPIRTLASGRTDAGVHALGQVASFVTRNQLPEAVFQRALNSYLPDDVRVRAVEPTGLRFHAMRDTLRKTYRYVIDDGPEIDLFRRRHVWKTRDRLNDEAMREASAYLLGRHDFAAYQSAGSPRPDTVRTVERLDIERLPHAAEELRVEITADGFLYRMVRNIVGQLVEVGRGAQPPESVATILAGRDRRQLGPSAPAHGLYLVSVEYE